MGKSVGDVKPGGSSRLSACTRQTGGDSDESGGGVLDQTSKKEKLRRLSSVGKISEMDQASQSISTNTTSKRVKLPKKFFDDCDTVNHASVPRKLRSAMKNRHHESVSPPLPNPRNGIRRFETPPKISRKKLKLDVEEHQQSVKSPKRLVLDERTKDEEEAAEALVVLAETCPGNEKADEINLNKEASEPEPSTMPEQDGPKTICQTNNNNDFANIAPNFPDLVQESEAKTPPEMPSSAKLPAWLANATLPCPPVTMSAKKDPKDVMNGKSWKRCSVHVHICRLIGALQVKDEGSNQIVNDCADKTIIEARNTAVLQKPLFQGQMNKREAGVMTQFRAPYLHSIAQNHAQNHRFSAAAGEQVNAQVGPYYGSPLYDPSQWLTPIVPKQQPMWVNQFMPGAQNPQYGPMLASNKGKMQFAHHDGNGGLFLVDSSSTLKLTSQ